MLTIYLPIITLLLRFLTQFLAHETNVFAAALFLYVACAEERRNPNIEVKQESATAKGFTASKKMGRTVL